MAGSAGRTSQEQETHLRRGRADGRRRQPTLTELLAEAETARSALTDVPYPRELLAAGRSRMEAEFRAYLRRSEATAKRRAHLNQQIRSGVDQARHCRELIAEAEQELKPAELLPRNSAEQRRDAEQLRRRREVWRGRRIATATGRFERCLADLAKLRADRADACQQLDQELASAKATARRIAEEVAQSIAIYWQGVLETHPEGEHIATVLPMTRLELPAWVTAPHRCGFLELPGEQPPDHDHDSAPEQDDATEDGTKQ